jgi:uncharacterized membrane protein HdeD (DUF308 family)
LLAILWLIGIYAIAGGVLELIAAFRMHQLRGEVRTGVGAMKPTAD